MPYFNLAKALISGVSGQKSDRNTVLIFKTSIFLSRERKVNVP